MIRSAVPATAVKAKSLQDLQQIQQRLADQRKAAEAKAVAQREAQRKADAERNLFVRAAGDVKPLRSAARVLHEPDQPPPIAFQQQLDEQRVLAESISDEFD